MRDRFYTLDALRGVAAIAVYFHHANGISAPISMPSGYRAVDLFFLLSGFVLAHAYAERLSRGMSVKQFIVARISRLYPLYFLGLSLGASSALLASLLGGGDMALHVIVMSTITMAFMVPSPLTPVLMPLNIPAWSLFFEMVSNIIYSYTARYLKAWGLAVLLSCSALLLLLLASYSGTTNIGAEWKTFSGGLARVIFSFFAGVVLYRHRPKTVIRTRWAWAVPIVAVAALFYGSEMLIVDLVCIFIVFPILIWLGAMLDSPDVMISSLLGDISYGLYVIHVPVILFVYRIFSYLGSDANRFAPWLGVISVSVLVPAVYVIDKYYDQPSRKWLLMNLRVNVLGVSPR